MFRDSYVAVLIVGDKIQKESDNGTVVIPFGSEYVLRLKNKLRKRAVADVWIDGKIACKGIVVDANGTVDLERFVEDGNLSEGKRFKLVRVTDPKVDQPNDSENGNIEVNFYPEKDAPVVEKTIIHEYVHDHRHTRYDLLGHCIDCCTDIWCRSCHPNVIYKYGGIPLGNGGVTYTAGVYTSGNISLSNPNSVVTSNSLNVSYSSDTKNLQASVDASNLVGEAAATVGGSISNQVFSSIFVDVDRSKPTTIRLTVKGLSKVIETCKCGYKRKKDVKYCPNDGTQLVV